MKKDYQFKLSQRNAKTGKTLTANLTARVTCNMDAEVCTFNSTRDVYEVAKSVAQRMFERGW